MVEHFHDDEVFAKSNFVGESDATDKELFISGYRYRNGKPIEMPFAHRVPAFSQERAEDGEYLTRRKEKEAVNHPAHYNSSPSGIECIEIVRHMNFNTGSAIKYLWRAGLKDGNPSLQDLRKAVWYLQDEISRLEHEEAINE